MPRHFASPLESARVAPDQQGRRMTKPGNTIRSRGAVLALLLLAACRATPEVEAPQTSLAFDAGLRLTAPDPAAPGCWAEELRPALFETVTEQRELSPERRDAAGAPARFASETHQRELRPRQQVWFRTPCPEEIGKPDVFTASLQRALKARGFYGGAVTGESTAETQAALQRYQAANGLESATLSLAAARALGLVAAF